VVSTRCKHGPSEILDDGRSGLLVPVADPISLGDAITRVLRDGGLRGSLIEEGMQRARDFTAEAIARAYADTLDAVCDEVGPL
jgi:glycosyltransferase involved in cell wall biosynthesis